MKADEFETWALAHGWKPHDEPGVSKPAWVIPCRIGRPGNYILVEFLQRYVRVSVTGPDVGRQRIITALQSSVFLENDIPRGMGLWTHPLSPYHYGGKPCPSSSSSATGNTRTCTS